MTVLPEAHVAHMSPRRLRLRIPSRKNDARYFASLKDWLVGVEGVGSVEVNPATGSVLIRHNLKEEQLALHARANNLFTLIMEEAKSPGSTTLHDGIAHGFQDLNRHLSGFTGGKLSLWDFAFLALLGTGIYQIARGNFAAPAWYTALWYAFNTFLKAPSTGAHAE